MSNSENNKETKAYMDYLENFSDDEVARNIAYEKRNNRNNRNRKGLKWTIIRLFDSKTTGYVLIGVLLAVAIAIFIGIAGCNKTPEKPEPVQTTTVAATEPVSHKIGGVPVIVQDDLKAACETYACTMLLQHFDFDIDEYQFVENYLVTKPVSYGADGNMYGPDMDSAYAGDIYTGYGVNAKGMAKFMNNYISTTGSPLKAQPLSGIPLETLCKDYILKDIPVMVWATTYMNEPYVKATWIVDYVDNDTETQIGDSVSWQMGEHCMVLIGFDKNNYYFCDSVAGKVAVYDKATAEERYSQLGMQAIVVK